MRVLFIGVDRGTSRHRRLALERCGHSVDLINPLDIFGSELPVQAMIWRAGGFGVAHLTEAYVGWRMGARKYDFCFVNHGETVSPRLVRRLRAACGPVALFNADNPFVARDGLRWRLLLRALPEYDSFATPRGSSVAPAIARGARHVIRFVQTADEIVHRPRRAPPPDRYRSDVAIVATWMPERGAFAAKLAAAGLPLKIFGPNWRKAPEYGDLAHRIAADRSLDDEDYVLAVQGARIAIGVVSEQNADEHTNRSVEIPAIGSLLCAARTPQHRQLYVEDVEAVFWRDAEECIAGCRALLADPPRLAAIAAAGHARMNASAHWNEQLMRRILSETLDAGRRDRSSAAR